MSKKEAVVVEEVKKPVLKANVAVLSEKIVNGLKLEKAEGIITETLDNYIDNLPAGLTPEIVEQKSIYDTEFVAASAHAVGTLAVEGLKSNKKVDTITAELSMGKHDKVRHAVDRSRTYNFGSGAERKEILKHGVVTTETDFRGHHGGSGQLKVARNIIAELATETLKGK